MSKHQPVAESSGQVVPPYRRNRWIVLFCWITALVWVGKPTQLSASFDSAVAAYDSGDYQLAIDQWQEAAGATADRTDASIEYNLGNGYFRRGDHGRAVLHWERALRLNPADTDARANLALVRGMLADPQPMLSPSVPSLVPLIGIARAVDLDQVTLVAFVAVQLLGLALFYWLVGGKGHRRVALVVAILATGVALPSSAVVTWRERLLADTSRFVVVADTIEVRGGPGEQFTTVHSVHSGFVVVEVGKSVGGWVSVRTPDGHEGWVPVHSVGRI